MRRVVLAVVMLLTVSVSVPTHAQTAPSGFAVLDRVPRGWYVIGATPAATSAETGMPFYADADDDGLALTVGVLDCDDGCPTIRGEQEEVPGLSGGVLVRNGRFRWVHWSSPQLQDAGNFVAGRDVSEAEIVAAAKGATTGPSGDVTGISRAALPDGVKQTGTQPTSLFGIPSGAQRITLLRADGRAAIDVWTARMSAAARRSQRFWSQQAQLMEGRPFPPAGLSRAVPRLVSVERRSEVSEVVGSGVDDDVLREVGSSVRPARAGEWERFRSKFRTVPASTLLPGAAKLRDPFVADGFVGDVRWAAVIASTDAGPNEFHFATLTADSSQVGKSSALFNAGNLIPPSTICGTQIAPRPGDFTAPYDYAAVGVVPAATQRLTVQVGDASPLDAKLGPVTPDGLHRYAWVEQPGLESLPPWASAIAYDSVGAVVAQAEFFGILTCG